MTTKKYEWGEHITSLHVQYVKQYFLFNSLEPVAHHFHDITPYGTHNCKKTNHNCKKTNHLAQYIDYLIFISFFLMGAESSIYGSLLFQFIVTITLQGSVGREELISAPLFHSDNRWHVQQLSTLVLDTVESFPNLFNRIGQGMTLGSCAYKADHLSLCHIFSPFLHYETKSQIFQPLFRCFLKLLSGPVLIVHF